MRTGDEEPAPEATRRALRDVIGRCLYGIDLNPMSAELCKVALWMESLEPGRPLSFLDHHIVVGNSLIGATAELIAAGVPDDAFTAIEGDDKAICAAYKKRNRTERDRQGNLFSPRVYVGPGLLESWRRLESESDESFGSVRKKAQMHREAQEAIGLRKLLADAWCGAFLQRKARGHEVFPQAEVVSSHWITTDTLRQLAAQQLPAEDVATLTRWTRERLAEYAPLHPELAFPNVFHQGGFDVVLGNPPWERVKLQEKEFFAERMPEIATAANKAERDRLIRRARGTALHDAYEAALRQAEASSQFIRKSGRFPLTGRGDVNTYAVFAELMRVLAAEQGRAGIIVPSGIATDDTTRHFFADLMERRSLVSLFDFENGMRPQEATEAENASGDKPAPPRKRPARTPDLGDRLLFAGVDSRFKFCLLTMRNPAPPNPRNPPQLATPHPPPDPTRPEACEPRNPRTPEPRNPGTPEPSKPTPYSLLPQCAFFCHRTTDLNLPDKVFTLSNEDIELLNPNTRTCPVFRSRRDAEITKAIYRRVPVLVRDPDPEAPPPALPGNPWGIKFQTMFHMSNDSHLFRTREHLESAGGHLTGNQWEVPAAGEADGLEIRAGRWLPLYEAKMIHHFDHRWATYETVTVARGKKAVGDPETRDVTPEEKADPTFVVQPRYWVHETEVDRAAPPDAGWFIGFRDICRSTDVRTAIFSVVPRTAVGHKLPLLHTQQSPTDVLCLLACASSFIFDYIVRQKLGGTSLTYGYLKQIPMLPLARLREPGPWDSTQPAKELIATTTLELTYTAHDLQGFAVAQEYAGPPFAWDAERRHQLRATLDAAFFHLYGISREDVAYIMDTFPIIKRHDEATFGHYRTRDTILEFYDAMAGGAMHRDP